MSNKENWIFKKYTCSICFQKKQKVEFEKWDDIFKHYEKNHNIKELWWCDSCNIFYTTYEHFSFHMEKCINVNQYI